jgi:uncharacterized protein DUF2695
MDKADKKARLKAWREQGRATARSGLPLSDRDFEALFNMLDDRLQDSGCDDTRKLTEEWLRNQSLPLVEVTRWLDDHGGRCDCEVLANAEEAGREASGRS